MIVCVLSSLFLVCVVGHEYNMGKCPQYSPMQGFQWEKFANVTWYVTLKTSTKSSCLTYTFTTNEKGFKSVKQARKLPYTDSIGLNHEYIYTGQLFSPEKWSRPAKMVAKFPLNMVGPSSFVILATDYDSYALLCTCQDMHLLALVFANRRSCSILQRRPEEDSSITKRMKDILLAEPALSDAEHDVDHLDVIDHDNCVYSGRPLTIDVDDTIGWYDGTAKEILESSNEIELSQQTGQQFKEKASESLQL